MGTSRPIDITDAEIKDLASGKSAAFGEHSRPRALTAKHVETLRQGGELKLEGIPVLERSAEQEGSEESGASQSAPQKFTHKDLEALREGRDIGPDKR